MNTARFFSFLLISCFVTGIIAQDAKEEALEKLYNLQNNMEYMRKALAPSFTMMAAQYNITNEQDKQQFQNEIFEEYSATIKDAFIMSYAKVFDLEEIEQLITFYESPVGRKLYEKQPELSEMMQKAGMQLANIMQKVAQNINVDKPEKPQELSEEHASNVIEFDSNAKKRSTTIKSEKQFNDEINHPGVTVVKFGASWCGPCRAYAPIFNDVAQHNQTVISRGSKVEVKYITVDIDTFPELATLCNVSPIPTTMFYKNGKEISDLKKEGYMEKDALLKKIKETASK